MKLISRIFTFAIAMVPIASVVACSSTTSKVDSFTYKDVHLDWDAVKTKEWKEQLAKSMKTGDVDFAPENFEITTVNSRTDEKFWHYEQTIHNKSDDSRVESYISLFKKGTNIDLLSAEAGINDLSSIKLHPGAAEHRLVSNQGFFYMASGYQADLFAKDGVIYNLPMSLTNPAFAGIFMSKDNIPTIVDSVSLKRGVNFEFNFLVNGKAYDHSIEQISGWSDPIKLYGSQTKVVYHEYYKPDVPLDLSTMKTRYYLAERTINNGITTTEDSGIIQPPFIGKIVPFDSSQDLKKFIIPHGKVLIVSSDPELQSLKEGDSVEAKYVAKDTEIGNLVKNSKWAVDCMALSNGPQVNTFTSSKMERASITPHIIKNGVQTGWVQDTRMTGPQHIFIVTDDYVGIATFRFNDFYADNVIKGKYIIPYLATLGVKEAVQLDGGGSAQQYINNNGQWVSHPNSVDALGERGIATSIAFGGKDE